MERRALQEFLRSAAEGFGVTLEEIAQACVDAKADAPVPSVAAFLPRVVEIESEKAAWDKRGWLFDLFVEEFGDRPVDAIKPGDIQRWGVQRRDRLLAGEEDRQRRLEARGTPGAPRRTGKGSQRSAIEAARAFFAVAVDDGLVRDNPAKKVRLPSKPAPKKRAVTAEQIQDLFTFAAGGKDPQLEATLFWFLLETGARRGGAMALRRRDLRFGTGEVALFEKGRIERLQPATAALLHALVDLAENRGAAAPGDHVFQYYPYGRDEPAPVTKKYFELLLDRLRQELPWAREVWLRMHDLRHTAITNIERISGSTAVARLFAGHADRQTTDTYDRADVAELRAAVEIWAGDLRS